MTWVELLGGSQNDLLLILQYAVAVGWTLAIALYSIFTVWDYVPSFMRYDKAFNDVKVTPQEQQLWTVQKSNFTHFYILSSAMSLAICTYCCNNGGNCILVVMYLLHSLRRLFECLFIHRFSSSRMAVAVYLGGLAYYCVCNCSILLVAVLGSNLSHVQVGVGLALYVIGSMFQHIVHRHLASLRQTAVQAPAEYKIPKSWCFSLVSSPHYLAEIVVYLGLLLVGAGHWLLSLNLLWVVVNLSCTAKKNHMWYMENGDASSLASSAIIPGIL